MATYRTAPTAPADIITYRLDGKLVFVKPAESYEEAVHFAQKVFPNELEDIPADRIMFNTVVNMGGQKTRVRISESAWKPTVAHLMRGEVLDIEIREESDEKWYRSEKEPPPGYLEVPDTDLKKATGRGRSKSHSPAPVNSRTGARITPTTKVDGKRPKRSIDFKLRRP